MVPVYRGGFDPGNTDTCLCAIDAQHNTVSGIVIPSFTSFGSLKQLFNKRSGSGDTYLREIDALAANEIVFKIKGSEYFVGDLASNAHDASTGRNDVGRYWSPRVLHLLLASSAKLIGRSEYALQIVTGLPIETYSRENRELMKAALEGEHQFEMNGRACRVTVEVLKVIMEGAGALIEYGDLTSPLQGAFDIGGRTTDLYAARGQKIHADFCKGRPIGVETIGERISSRANAVYGRDLRPGEIKNCLRSYLGQSQYEPVNARGGLVSANTLQEWTVAAVEEVGSAVLGFVAEAWHSSESGEIASEIRPVVLCGGGAYYFHRMVKSRIPHAIMPTQPERANARGYAALANALAVHQRMSA